MPIPGKRFNPGNPSGAGTIAAGCRRVDEAGPTMRDILAQVQSVYELISEISEATANHAHAPICC
jgi:methyl-accepting chemotaxis protein